MSQHRTKSARHRARRHAGPHLPTREGPRGPEDGPDPLAEACCVAGHGASSTIEYQSERLRLPRAFHSLRERDFRLFWCSQVISLIGTWMQTVAQGWLVLQMTNSAFLLGVIGALQFLPILLFSIVGGVIADRLPKQKVLIVTQSAGLVLAIALGVLTATNRISLGGLMALALLFGLVTAVDLPTRQAFVAELVRGRSLPNAIALNSAAFNGARLIGPAVAGLAIGWIGLAGCFFANGLSFVFPIIALFAIHAGRVPFGRGVEVTTVSDDLRAGLGYVRETPVVRSIMLIVALVGTFGMNVTILVPLLARDVLGVGAVGYGYLTAATGVGALAAALGLAQIGHRIRAEYLLGAAAALGLVQVTLAGTTTYSLAAAQLVILGFAMISFTTLANMVLQLRVPDALRGRVMSLYTTVFAGTAPFGALFAGAIAEKAGVPAAFLVGGLISACVAALAFMRRPGR
jgi:MFS family permease